MPEILDYNRPKATIVEDVPIPFKLLMSELTKVPDDVPVDGTTAALDAYVRTQVPSGWLKLFRIETSHTLSLNGVVTINITTTPILGDQTNGTPKTFTYVHDQAMDTYQQQAGFGRP